jgi:REP element-mobilizing transposase RayT
MGNLPVRKPNRLEKYDYGQPGAYFLTICTDGHRQLFGAIALGSGRLQAAPTSLMQLSSLGKIVEAEIMRLSSVYAGVYVDRYVIMPNHVHMIVVIRNDSGRSQTAPTVSRIIQQWKGAATKKAGRTIWQKSYHDHIIRNSDDHKRIADYIQNNPATWEADKYFVGHKRQYSAPDNRLS